ncbi:MAG: hypothetical protein EBQ96_00185 [Proteobacteria bacterium]|nr:hypothetical protein [Pseudomonadota bacterium]
MKNVLALILFLATFTVGTLNAQQVNAVDPTVPVQRTEEQLVRETVCAAMQNEDTYKTKGMAFYKKIVAGDDGWVFRTITDFRTDFTMVPQTLKYMKRLHDAFAAQGIEFIYLIPPTRGLANGEHATGNDPESIAFQKKRDAAQAGYHDMLKTLGGAGMNVIGFHDLDTGKPYFYKRDHHWNPDGAKLAAERVASFIKTKPVYATLTKTPYMTKDMGVYDYSGPFAEILQPICKLFLMAEKTNKFETFLAEKASNEAALFDEKKFPEVVLVGTSNSSADPSVANFEGFLKEALQTDVYNVSIVGAGIDTPLLAYLNSDEFRDHKPKVVIWEVPGYYDMDVWHSRIYRQAIPAIVGECSTSPVAEAKGIKVDAPSIAVLKDIGGKKIAGSGNYLTFRFSEPIKKPVTLTFKYKNWDETYRINRSPRYPADGLFYMLLKDTKAGNLQGVTLQMPEEAIGKTVDARICKLPASLIPSKAQTSSKKKNTDKKSTSAAKQ